MPAQAAPITVLVIDDVRLFSLVTGRAMRAAGYDVLLAEDGRRGLEMVRAHRPQVVILDIMMPELNGVEVLRAIRSDPSIAGTPVLVVSALGDSEMMRQAVALRIEGRLLKSTYSLTNLLNAVGRLIPNPSRVTEVA